MKILMTTYYYDFARYFLYLQDQFKAHIDTDLKFEHICFYPSAYLYLNDHNIDAKLAYKFIDKIEIDNIKELTKKDKYKGISLDEIIKFNYKSQKMFDLDNKKELKILAIKYIEYFASFFREEKFDIFISSGDTRMATEIAIHFAKKNDVKIWYFEQGPFNTTMIDEQGVNCNISFTDQEDLDSNINLTDLNSFVENYKKNRREKIYDNNDFSIPLKYRLDLLYLYTPFFLRRFIPTDLQTGESFFRKLIFPKIKKIVNKFVKKRNNVSYPDNAILFILQVPVDAQMIEHSPNYDNFYDMLIAIYNNIPPGYNLVVREHPGNKGNYDKKLYEFINNNENVFLINEGGLQNIIKRSKLIILNNSTVGIEALTYYKPVLTLGKAYYNRENVVYNLKEKRNLASLINKALTEEVNIDKINIFLYNFIFDYLYYGHFQDINLINGDKIVKDIISSYKKKT